MPVGTDAITAEYIPDAASKYGGSTSPAFNEVILPTPPPNPIQTTTAVTPKSQQITAGSEAGFTITVSPAAVPGTDTVTMYEVAPPNPGGGSPTYALLLGTAAYNSANSDWTFTTTTPLPVGVHEIEAAFGGDANYAPSNGLASVTVVPTPPPPAPTPTTTAVTPKSQQITAGSEASFTITVSPATVPGTDTVTMYDNVGPGNPAGNPSPTFLLGTAAYNSANSDWTFTTTTPLPVGTNVIDAAFSGDANYAPSNGSASVVVVPATPPPTLTPTTTVVTPKSQQITAGSEASFTITVSPATVPSTDTVTLYAIAPANVAGGVSTKILLGTAVYDSADSDWTFTTTAPLPVGLNVIDAEFSGDANFAASSGLASVLVVPPPTTPPPGPQQGPALGNAVSLPSVASVVSTPVTLAAVG